MKSIDILIVEDDNAHIRLIEHSLTMVDDQFRLRVATDLCSCRKALAQQLPDILLLDLNLPDGNALDLLRELDPDPPFPTLIMTAGGSESLAVEALKSGALDYVIKSPDTFAELGRIITRALRERRTRDQHRLAVEALRLSEEKYRLLFQEFDGLLNAVSDILLLLDPQNHILWSNHAAATNLGMQPEQMVGLPCYSLFKKRDKQCHGCIVTQTIRSGQTQNITERLDNGETWDNRTFPLFDGKGQVIKVILMKRNITEQKRLQDEAARASRLAVLGELSAGIAHEINNPNALIRYNSDMLHEFLNDLLPYLKKSLPDPGDLTFGGLTCPELIDEIPQMVNTIQDASGRIKHIVDDLRDFARKDLFNEEAFIDLNKVVEASVRLATNVVARSTDHFVVELAEDLPPLSGVQGRLEQVIINLLINSCQALTNRDQKITVSTHCSDNREQLFLSVTDEGRGIPADILDRIFEPFVTTRRQEGGTGLGLSVSARIVKEHRGTLNFTSTPGKGTTATLMLPAVKESLS